MSPYSSKYEEQRQGNNASEHGDDSRANDEGWPIYTCVILDGRVPEVVHATDSSTTENTPDRDSPPGDIIIRANSDKGGQENDNRDEKGDGSKATGVCYLQVAFVVR
jgi:hypothetical protein